MAASCRYLSLSRTPLAVSWIEHENEIVTDLTILSTAIPKSIHVPPSLKHTIKFPQQRISKISSTGNKPKKIRLEGVYYFNLTQCSKIAILEKVIGPTTLTVTGHIPGGFFARGVYAHPLATYPRSNHAMIEIDIRRVLF